MQTDKGIFNALFDFSFSSFLTTRLVRILYFLAMLLAALFAFGMMISGFSQGFFAGLFSLLVGVLVFFVYVIAARVWLELIIVVFRIAENVSAIAERKSGDAVPPAAPPID